MQYKLLLISLGDPAGVGYEIILKILPKINSFIPVLIGDKTCLDFYLDILKIKYNPFFITENLLTDIKILNVKLEQFLFVDVRTNIKKFHINKINKSTGKIAFYSLEMLTKIVKNMLYNQYTKFAVLTMPVSK